MDDSVENYSKSNKFEAILLTESGLYWIVLIEAIFWM